MGGEGPAVRFMPEDRQKWAEHTGLAAFSPADLEAAYARAKDFLVERKEMLISTYGWEEDKDNDTSHSQNELFALSSTIAYKHEQSSSKCHVRLPSTFAAFLDNSQSELWEKMFSSKLVFNKRGRTWGDIFIDSPAPLADIFYLLQVLSPGLLVIYRINEYDENGEDEITRILPRAAWLEEHAAALQYILGDEEAYGRLLEAEGSSRGYHREMISDWSGYRHEVREPLDYTACDQGCGYCGKCDY